MAGRDINPTEESNDYFPSFDEISDEASSINLQLIYTHTHTFLNAFFLSKKTKIKFDVRSFQDSHVIFSF